MTTLPGMSDYPDTPRSHVGMALRHQSPIRVTLAKNGQPPAQHIFDPFKEISRDMRGLRYLAFEILDESTGARGDVYFVVDNYDGTKTAQRILDRTTPVPPQGQQVRDPY